MPTLDNNMITFDMFLNKINRGRNGIKLPNALDIFNLKVTNGWKVIEKENDLYFMAKYNGSLTQNINFTNLLDLTLPPNAVLLNDAVINHFENNNKFIDNLPLFIIRRHGNHSGKEGSLRRRRGWLVRFENAWIVYADNFFAKHIFEASYFISKVEENEINQSILKLKMPFSSGGGTFEKKHRVFPSLTHLTSKSGLYLSHIYGLNNGRYFLNNNGNGIKASEILGRGKDSHFGYGEIAEWDTGNVIIDNKKYRVINKVLTDNELNFLKAYNIRMLSPLNYFPFPKKQLIEDIELSGESEKIIEYVIEHFAKKYSDSFIHFQQYAKVKA